MRYINLHFTLLYLLTSTDRVTVTEFEINPMSELPVKIMEEYLYTPVDYLQCTKSINDTVL